MFAPYGIDRQGNPYGPNPTQEFVLQWKDDNVERWEKQGKEEIDQQGNGIPVLYLQGGVGSGKTRAILAAADELLFEIPNLRALWGRHDFNDLRLSAMETFFEVVPPQLIIGQNIQEHRYKIGQPDNKFSQIFFRDLKDIGGLGSQEFGLICITELHETTMQAYRTLKMRCRQANVPTMIMMEGNPPNEGHWIDDLTDPKHPDYDKDIHLVTVSTYENWPNLPDVYKVSLEGMPESWKKKFMFGKFGFMPDGKPFYSGFLEQLHTGDFKWNEHREVLVGWDFGFHHPAVVASQIDDWDRWVILKCIMGSDITIDRFCDQVIQQFNIWFPNGRFVHMGDPACVQVNDKSERTSWDICRDKGILILYRDSDYRLRKEIIEQRLSRIVNKKPQLLINNAQPGDNNQTIIDGFLGGYHYPTHKEQAQFTGKMETPFRDGWYEHLMNAVEYIAVNTFSPLKPRGPRGPRAPKRRAIRDNI